MTFYGSVHEVTGIEDIDELDGPFEMLGQIGQSIKTVADNTIGKLPIIGDVHKAITSAIPLPGTSPSGVLDQVNQGVTQALGVTPATGILGSVLGAGLGGVTPGTGPLPGIAGTIANQLFNRPAIPPAEQARMVAPPQQYSELAQHTDRVGRAVVRRVLGLTTPELRDIRELLKNHASQLQATAEHRDIVGTQDFRRQVLEILNLLRARFATSPVVAAGLVAPPGTVRVAATGLRY